MRRLEHRLTDESWQITFSVIPLVTPIVFAARVKGRLQHALRQHGNDIQFRRKLSVRTIGDNTRADVEAYILKQVDKEQFADAHFRMEMREFTVQQADVDLAQPTVTNSGRYWYNLHVVLIVAQRHRLFDRRCLETVRNSSVRIAAKKGWAISILSVMPDHLHVALRGNLDQSPDEIALALLNNLAYALGQRPHLEPGYYVGTFSEYDMNAVRHRER